MIIDGRRRHGTFSTRANILFDASPQARSAARTATAWRAFACSRSMLREQNTLTHGPALRRHTTPTHHRISLSEEKAIA